jgi:dolichol-phosphate mannosyltransferase
MGKKLISICIPVLNESENIESLIFALKTETKKLGQYKFEFVFSDNNSDDDSWEKIKALSKMDKRIRGIKFSKNIGYQNSILQNYFYAEGQALIVLDADLQDPPELIKIFLKEWENGFQIIYGVRKVRKGSRIDSVLRSLGYSFLSWASDNALHMNVGDFRLIDRSVVEVLRTRNHSHQYLRGVISSLGFKEKGIPYSRNIRKKGKSKFNAFKVLKLGLLGLMSFSTKPIRLFIPISIFFILLSIFGIAWVILLNLTHQDLPRGFSVTQIFIFTSIGVNSLFFAIAGDYLHKIYISLNPKKNGFIQESL